MLIYNYYVLFCPTWLGQYEGKFFELGVSMKNESMPLMYNFTTIDETTQERIEQVFCFGNFTGAPPSSKELLIPNICLNEGLTIKSIPKKGNQRFLPSYFAIPPAIHAPAMAAWLRNAL